MSNAVSELTGATFPQTVSEGVALVDFWAPWCAPCRMQAPVLDTVAGKVGTRAKIVKVDVDDNMALASRFGVQSIPTLILLKDGQEVRRFVGVQSADVLVAAIESAL